MERTKLISRLWMKLICQAFAFVYEKSNELSSRRERRIAVRWMKLAELAGD